MGAMHDRSGYLEGNQNKVRPRRLSEKGTASRTDLMISRGSVVISAFVSASLIYGLVSALT